MNAPALKRGGARVGEANGSARLTAPDVVVIHGRLAAGETSRAIAPDYGVSHKTIASIADGRTWGHLGLPRLARRLDYGGRSTTAAAKRAAKAARPPMLAVDAHASFAEDCAARALVVHLGAMSREDVAAALGVSCERVRQIEERALHSLRARCVLAGIRASDLADALASRPRTHADRCEELSSGNEARGTKTHSAETEITDGPLVELERALSAVEAHAEYVDNITQRATRHA